ENHVDGDVLDALDAAGGVLHPAGHLAGDGTAGRGQRHVDDEVAVVVEIDPVDEAQLVDIDRNFRIVDRFQRADEIGGDALDLGLGQSGGQILRHPRIGGSGGILVAILAHGDLPQAKNLRARSMPSTSASTSSLPLYRAKEARQVEVTPNRSSRGWAQWVPARTAMP